MRKLALTLAALAAIGIAAPYAANAEMVVIHKHHHHLMPVHHDKTVIIKHDDHDHDHDHN